MNVSSVKNLNGETFSAVQDATLTDVVQTNSAQWNEISAYEEASASYLTAHQSLEDYATTADVNSISSMLSGAIDYVSSNAGGGGGTTYTSPSGTILINDNTIEASTSAIGNYVKTVNVISNYNNYSFSAIPGYPFDSYSAQRTAISNYLYLRYGTWSDGFDVQNAMTADTIEIPLTSGGYDLWLYNGDNVTISAVKSDVVVKLATKDDLTDYATIIDKNDLSASITNVSSNLYELSGKTFSGSRLGTIVVEGQNIEASTSGVTQVADTSAVTSYSDAISITSMPNYPYSTYKFGFGQGSNSVQAIYGNWTYREYFSPDPQGVATIPTTFNGANLSMVGYGLGVLSGIKSSVVELALASDLPTFNYDSTNKISAINGSALAGGGGGLTGDYVSGVNLVKNGNEYYAQYTACKVSGDIIIEAGSWSPQQGYQPWYSYSVANAASSINSKLSQYSTDCNIGRNNNGSGVYFAQGYYNSAYDKSMAQGSGCYASSAAQAFGDHVSANKGMAIGTYNDNVSASFVIGNGTDSANRSDLFVIDYNGNVSAAGKISANGVELGAGGAFPASADNAIQYLQGLSGTLLETNTLVNRSWYPDYPVFEVGTKAAVPAYISELSITNFNTAGPQAPTATINVPDNPDGYSLMSANIVVESNIAPMIDIVQNYNPNIPLTRCTYTKEVNGNSAIFNITHFDNHMGSSALLGIFPSEISNVEGTAYYATSYTYKDLALKEELPDTSTLYTTAEANTLSSMLSGAIDYVSSNAGGGGGESKGIGENGEYIVFNSELTKEQVANLMAQNKFPTLKVRPREHYSLSNTETDYYIYNPNFGIRDYLYGTKASSYYWGASICDVPYNAKYWSCLSGVMINCTLTISSDNNGVTWTSSYCSVLPQSSGSHTYGV